MISPATSAPPPREERGHEPRLRCARRPACWVRASSSHARAATGALRFRSEIAAAAGVPAVASLSAPSARGPGEWRALLKGYEPSAGERWALRKLLRTVMGAGAPPAEVTVVSLASDEAAIAVAPLLASFRGKLRAAHRARHRRPHAFAPSRCAKCVTRQRSPGSPHARTSRSSTRCRVRPPTTTPAVELTVRMIVTESSGLDIEGSPGATTLFAVSAGAATPDRIQAVAEAARTQTRPCGNRRDQPGGLRHLRATAPEPASTSAAEPATRSRGLGNGAGRIRKPGRHGDELRPARPVAGSSRHQGRRTRRRAAAQTGNDRGARDHRRPCRDIRDSAFPAAKTATTLVYLQFPEGADASQAMPTEITLLTPARSRCRRFGRWDRTRIRRNSRRNIKARLRAHRPAHHCGRSERGNCTTPSRCGRGPRSSAFRAQLAQEQVDATVSPHKAQQDHLGVRLDRTTTPIAPLKQNVAQGTRIPGCSSTASRARPGYSRSTSRFELPSLCAVGRPSERSSTPPT